MELEFPNITVILEAGAMIFQSKDVLRTLASAVVGGGLTEVRYIINRHVAKNYHHPDPERDLRDFAKRQGIDEPFVGLMTAADLDRACAVTLREEQLTVAAIVTTGLSNPTAAGLSLPAVLTPGTINLVLLADAYLGPAAMVNAVITATEAKAVVLLQQGVRTPEGHPATGTSTDAVVVACTGRGSLLPYAGPATPVGWLIGQGVRQALAQALG